MEKKHLTTLTIAALFTTAFLFPVFLQFSTHLPSRADGVLISWLIYTVSTLISEGKNFFELPFFYPFTQTLTYSDPFLPTAIFTIPLLQLTQNIVAIHNFHLITGTVVLYLAMFALGRQLNYSQLGSHVSAILATFSPIHLEHTVHLQSYLLAGIPLTLLFITKWQDTKKWSWLALSFGAFLYQALNSPMSGFFVLFCVLPTVVNKKFVQKIVKHLPLVLYYSILSGALLAAVYYQYFQTAQTMEYVRSIRDAAHFSHSLKRLFQTDLLILYALLFIFWKTKSTVLTLSDKTARISQKQILWIIGIGAVLMLGPVLKLDTGTVKIFGLPIPLPYSILYYVVPGFKAFRDSSRFIVLLNFGIALLMGNYITLSKIKSMYKSILVAMIIFSIFHLSQTSFELYEIPTTTPPIYESVAQQKESTLIELPIFSWGMMPYNGIENDRLMYQATHKKTLFNGVSGFLPPQRDLDIAWFWRRFPNSQTLEYLQDHEVELILVHYDLFETMAADEFIYSEKSSPTAKELQDEIELQTELELIHCAEEKCLYKLK